MNAVLLIVLMLPLASQAATVWGRLANPGYEGQRIKTTFFFPGPARDGSARAGYNCKPGDTNMGNYTLHPEPESLHQNWSLSDQFSVMNMMVDAGINVITMSSWGEDFLGCNDGWVTGAAPMQVSPQAQNELFDAAATRGLLIAPLIETRFNLWSMREEFPRWTDGRVSPGLVSQIVNLIGRYLQNPSKPEWARAWAQVYDQDGLPRFAVGLIHTASDNLDGDRHSAFAEGFDLVAAEVFKQTGIRVGFFLDAIAANGNIPNATFKPSSRFTAPSLLKTKSLLGIQCFAPEIWVDESGDDDILAWKRGFLVGWISAGIPTLVDVSPGYDAHLVFPDSKRYGLGEEWFRGMTSIVNDLARGGMIYNSWNGYTEAMVGTPTRGDERGTMLYEWLKGLNAQRELFVDAARMGPQSGTASEPFRAIGSANDVSSNGDVIFIQAGRYPEGIRFTNRLRIVAKDGAVTIGGR